MISFSRPYWDGTTNIHVQSRLCYRVVSVSLSSVALFIVAKRCVLEQKLLLTAYRKPYMRNRLVQKLMTLTLTFLRGRIKVKSTIVLHSTLNISETVRDRGLVPKDHQKEMAYGLSNCQVTDDVT